MKAIILRRRKLGRTSCREISNFSKEGLVPLRNDKQWPLDYDMVFRWGCTSDILKDVVVVNSAKAIHQVADKAGFRKLTADAGLAPKTWLSYEEFLDDPNYQKKVVVRRSTHHQGRYLDLCETLPQVQEACEKYGKGNYYISEYIPKVAEYRVFIVSGRVVWVAQKTPANPDAIAWNVAKGGRFDNVGWDNWPLKAIRVARESFVLSQLDFGGVDVMVDNDGNCYVLEINSAPSQTSPYRQQCTSKAFDYIVKYGKESIPLTQERGGWRKFIHPAISNEAIIE